MITERILLLFSSFIKFIFSGLNLPDVPAEFVSVVDILFTNIKSVIGFLFLLFNIPLLTILLSTVLATVSFKTLFKFIMFVVKKIPFIDIH